MPQSKYDTSFTSILFISCLATFLIGIGYLLIVLNATNKDVDELSKRVESLTISNANYKLDIKIKEEQIESYKIENDNLKYSNISYREKIGTLNKEEKTTKTENVRSPDLMLLAQLIQSESGNQSFKGKLAVGTVVMNRVESEEFPDTIKDVIFQKNQFSVVKDGSIYNEPSDESLEAAKKILNGLRVLDSDVLYFYNPELVGANWVRSRKVIKQIGDHAFAI